MFFVYISSIVLTCFLHFSPRSIFSHISHIFYSEFDLFLKLEAGEQNKNSILTNDMTTKFDG